MKDLAADVDLQAVNPNDPPISDIAEHIRHLKAVVYGLPNVAVARERYPTYVAMEQLGLPIDQAGFNLHLPISNCNALLINRFLHCQNYKSFADSFGT